MLSIFSCQRSAKLALRDRDSFPYSKNLSIPIILIAKNLNKITDYHTIKNFCKSSNKESNQNRYSSKNLLDQAFPKVPYSENKFVMVKGDKSPYDGDLIYWSARNSKLYDGETSLALKRQNHSCCACGLKFTSEEKVHLHHADGNHNNWKRNNLVAIHKSCHQYQHMSKSKTLRVSEAG